VPDTATVAEVLHDVFGLDHLDPRAAHDLSLGDVAALRTELCQPVRSSIDIGYIGPCACLDGHYARATGAASIEGATIPYCVECWASCTRAQVRDGRDARLSLLINRSPSLAQLTAYSRSEGLVIHGCGLSYCSVLGPKTGRYDITLSLITPYLRLANDGKTPVLCDFERVIIEAIRRAAGAAYRAMARPPRRTTVKDAAWAVMEAAYLQASDAGTLPANARQIMYVARPYILAVTGVDKLGDAYFTQILLPDFVAANPVLCANWDVVFDARGHFIEPHTFRTIPLGTIEVRSYLGDRPQVGLAVALNADRSYQTSGPENRYRNILFVEKEGFGPLLEKARIAERFDIAIMSTKGMSVTASRILLDRLAPQIDKVLIFHDFDVAGFSIFGTIGTDSRRYLFKNNVAFVDIGLRLADIEAMGLAPEPIEIPEHWGARSATLRKHGATPREIQFLRTQRVELNAMTSRQFIDFLETKLAENGVEKVVPDIAIIEGHARRLTEQRLASAALSAMREQIATAAADIPLPEDIESQLRRKLATRAELSWDEALAEIIDESEQE
jgi:hypothetical protein